MIRYLEGTVISKEERSFVLLVQGVGYQILTSAELLSTEEGAQISVYIHTHVREDEISLYGFSSPKELKFFELLLTVNGVGPKMALETLNQPMEITQEAILTGNLPNLTRIPGVGRKIAERLVLELKGKVEATSSGNLKNIPESSTVHPDIIVSLESLGYKRHHIQKVLSTMEEDLVTEEEIVRFFLQNV